jgi:hypothetical protein
MRLRAALLLACIIAACGGRTIGGGSQGSSRGSGSSSGGQSTGSGSEGASGGGAEMDAESFADASGIISIDAPSSVTCEFQGGEATTTNPCTLTVSEHCSDGVGYRVSCACPDATCSCTRIDPNSGGGTFYTGALYDGCPNCRDTNAAQLFAACDFPN